MLGLTFAGLSGGALASLYGGLALGMVLLYVLKLRRRRVAVPFSPLWATIISERQSSALFRRLKRLWSLLLQLVLLGLVVGALGDPRPDGLSGCGFAPPEPPPTHHTLVLVDTSASMNSLSAGERRFDAALDAAERVLESAGQNPEHRLMLAAADVTVRPLTLWTTERAVVRDALEALRQDGPRGTPTDVPRTLEVMDQVLRGREGAQVVWITDQAFEPAAIDPELPLEVVSVGQPGVNVGLEGFNVRPALDDGLAYAIFFAVRNTSPQPLKTTVHLYANESGVSVDDFVQEAQIVSSVALTVPPNSLLRHVLTDVSFEGSRLAARVAIDADEPVHDVFETDDVAFAVVPPRKRLAVQLVTEGNLFLQASLFLRENVDLTVVTPEAYAGPRGATCSSTPPRVGCLNMLVAWIPPE
ncbi:MAG: vWA domain-containing protein [Myxococcota bacterium]